MKKINTSAISGMQELLPHDQNIFNTLKEQIAREYHLHGYQYIETPVIERTEILLAKAGGDTEKQIYKVVKTAETINEADQALRFDHTVPLARYVVEHENDLPFPFKVTQIGRNYRGERSQKGRFREFYQMDVDVIGRDNLPILYDADVVFTAFSALRTFIRPDIRVRISNRKILSGLLAELSLESKSAEIFNIIDHAEKKPRQETEKALRSLNLADISLQRILDFIQIQGTREQVITALKALNIKQAIFLQGVEELDLVLSILESQGLKNVAVADMLIIRGLDYYTGTVFETILPDYKKIGSICSGGRYENLASNYTSQRFPGVGISIGLTRLFYVLKANNLLADYKQNIFDYSLAPLSEKEYQFSFEVAKILRAKGKTVDIIYTDKKLVDKIKYATKTSTYFGAIGDIEVSKKQVEFKNLITGEKHIIQCP